MKRKVSKLKGVFLAPVIAASTISSPAHAGGFPVIDVTNIAQSIMQYAQMLTDYANQLGQLNTQLSSYVQMVTDWNQTIQEYGHYVNQISGFHNSISNGEWNTLLQQTLPYFGNETLSLIAGLDPNHPNFVDQLNNVLNDYNYLPRDIALVANDLAAIGTTQGNIAAVGEKYGRLEGTFSRYKNVQQMVAQNETDANSRRWQLLGLAIRSKGLGNESDLATAQFQVAQTQVVMNQNESINRTLNQILQQQSIESAERASNDAQSIDREINRLAAYTPNTAPLLGRNRWGAF